MVVGTLRYGGPGVIRLTGLSPSLIRRLPTPSPRRPRQPVEDRGRLRLGTHVLISFERWCVTKRESFLGQCELPR
jgi:hypothetical protein